MGFGVLEGAAEGDVGVYRHVARRELGFEEGTPKGGGVVKAWPACISLETDLQAFYPEENLKAWRGGRDLCGAPKGPDVPEVDDGVERVDLLSQRLAEDSAWGQPRKVPG